MVQVLHVLGRRPDRPRLACALAGRGRGCAAAPHSSCRVPCWTCPCARRPRAAAPRQTVTARAGRPARALLRLRHGLDRGGRDAARGLAPRAGERRHTRTRDGAAGAPAYGRARRGPSASSAGSISAARSDATIGARGPIIRMRERGRRAQPGAPFAFVEIGRPRAGEPGIGHGQPVPVLARRSRATLNASRSLSSSASSCGVRASALIEAEFAASTLAHGGRPPLLLAASRRPSFSADRSRGHRFGRLLPLYPLIPFRRRSVLRRAPRALTQNDDQQCVSEE